jgi:RNA recognition motif-containing protein
MGAKLYVGNLPYSVTEERLQQHFAQYGSVVSARIITDKFSGRSKGFGFVEMSSDEEAQRATTALNGTDFEGRNVVVSEARPQAPRDSRPGGGGGGRPPRRDRY